jgi:beta-lactam-binding protein with PASTA domain
VPMSDTTLPNTAIDVTVSLGSRPFAMPNVKGMRRRQCHRPLGEQGAEGGKRTTRRSSGFFGTTVLTKQDPLPGAEVVRGGAS